MTGAEIIDLPLVKRHPEVGDHFAELLANIARPVKLPVVYPLYHAHVIRNALLAAVPTADGMIDAVTGIETIGDCRYAITTRDHSGQKYRITVMVENTRGDLND